MTTAHPVVDTVAGQVRGERRGEVEAFLGIPYAAAPTGLLRFRAPHAVTPWSGVRDATHPGATAPKSPYPEGVRAILPELNIPGEEYLNLNVWRPTERNGKPLPVFVWVHGGSYTQGSGANSEYDGSSFARGETICVTFNYRLGVEGFLEIAGADSNRGLRDMLAALTWVHANISMFGGDPERVTLGGESAGAMAVATLMAVPSADPLFAQAVLQSGAGTNVVVTPEQAARVSHAVATRLRIEPTSDELAAVPADDLRAAADAVSADIRSPGGAARWGKLNQRLPLAPVVDGELLPHSPDDRLAVEAQPRRPLLIGTNKEEGRLFFVPGRAIDAITDAMVAEFCITWGITDKTPFIGPTPGETFVAAYTHARFTHPAEAFASNRATQPTWTYRFEGLQREDNHDLGSCHTTEVPFVFNTIDDPELTTRLGMSPSHELARSMHDSWRHFIAGHAPWTTHDIEVLRP